jgi:hypothetical protein
MILLEISEWDGHTSWVDPEQIEAVRAEDERMTAIRMRSGLIVTTNVPSAEFLARLRNIATLLPR